jgi:hypothetical protein
VQMARVKESLFCTARLRIPGCKFTHAKCFFTFKFLTAGISSRIIGLLGWGEVTPRHYVGASIFGERTSV